MKAIAIATTQLVLALAVMTAGVVVLTLPEDLAQSLMRVGYGDVTRVAIGGLQIVAGLCLMVPRAQVAGTTVLAVMAAGLAVGAIVHAAGEMSATARRDVPRLDLAVAGTCGAGQAIVARGDWKI